MLITSLKPNITRERATGMCQSPLRELRYGSLKLMLDFYLPYHLFRVETESGRKTSELWLAIDAVTGRLDPYRFDDLPVDSQLMQIETARFAPAQLSEQEAINQLEEKMMRMSFMRGFFKLSRWRMNGRMVESFHLPYWMGVYERQGRARLEVIDALRGRFEGTKLREMIAEWFQTPGA